MISTIVMRLMRLIISYVKIGKPIVLVSLSLIMILIMRRILFIELVELENFIDNYFTCEKITKDSFTFFRKNFSLSVY